MGPTYFRGSKPIDVVWATADLDVVGACIMPSGFGIGDHQLFVINFLASLVVGITPEKIVCPQARRLNCRLPMVVQRYNTRYIKHNYLERRQNGV